MKALNSDRPRRDLANSDPSSEFLPPARTSARVETLLVVDDDKSLREVEAEFLGQKGYSVLQAESAAEALRLAGEAAAIDLLITDFSMLEVDGLELTRRFRALHPKTPVLMVSGSLSVFRDHTHDLDRFELLAKPFGLAELLDKVRTLLDAAVLMPRRKPWRCD